MCKELYVKLESVFQDLGLELKRSGSSLEFEYENMPVLLSVDVENQSFTFMTYVAIAGDDDMGESTLNMALDVVAHFHNGYFVDWNDGFPYFASPCYSLKCNKNMSVDWMKDRLKEFYDAYSFLDVNLHLVSDNSILDEVQRTKK